MEMKKEWIRPLTKVQQFLPNEYCSTCGQEKQVYKFVCDAETKWGSGLTGSTVYANGSDGISGTSDDVKLGSYKHCGTTHEASTSDEFISGYMIKNVLGVPTGSRLNVIIWRGEDGKNIHCTTNLNKDSWEVDRS